MLAIFFTFCSWINIHQMSKEVMRLDMIRYDYLPEINKSISCLFRNLDQQKKRIEEEKRWLLQSWLILAGFLVSLAPIFSLYIFSIISSTTVHPVINLLAWSLFFSGASFNFLIYNCINPTFRKKFLSLFCKEHSLNISNSRSTKTSILSRLKSN